MLSIMRSILTPAWSCHRTPIHPSLPYKPRVVVPQRLDPDTLLSKAKKNHKPGTRAKSDMPASLRKMLRLKAAAQGKPQYDDAATAGNQHTSRATQKEPECHRRGGEADFDLKINTNDEPQQSGQQPLQNGERQPPTTQIAQPPVVPSSLKARKREFLKLKKLRKKGKLHALTGSNKNQGDDKNEPEDPEGRLQAIAAATKPDFAEVADAPIQVNLKRKHWTENGSKEKESKRCSEIFRRQLEQAQARVPGGLLSIDKEQARMDLAAAYRRKTGPRTHPATIESLAELVRRDGALN
jgi:hypothetical protein